MLLGSRQGVPAEASKNARDSLVGALLECVRKPANQRYVTLADLLTTFQRKTFVTLPPGLLEGLAFDKGAPPQIETGSTTRDIAEINLTSRSALRSAEVNRLHATLVLQGRLWLHGSSGLGKTTLAVLLARSQAVPWRFADLRDLSEPALRSVLFSIAINFRESGARGLVLDDLPSESSNTLIFAVAQVAQAVADFERSSNHYWRKASAAHIEWQTGACP